MYLHWQVNERLSGYCVCDVLLPTLALQCTLVVLNLSLATEDKTNFYTYFKSRDLNDDNMPAKKCIFSAQNNGKQTCLRLTFTGNNYMA